MKKATFLVVAFLLSISLLASIAYDSMAVSEGKKITPIRGIILVPAEETMTNFHYDESIFWDYINKSRLKFVTRARLKEILSEQSLAASGLTMSDQYKRVG